MRVESCTVCLEDLAEHVEATYRCTTCELFYCSGDGKRHAKKYPNHSIEELKSTTTTSIPNNMTSSSLILNHGDDEICKHHGYPINSYCRQCNELICASCALDVMHKQHDCHLIDQIFHDEKIKFQVDLETLKKRVSQFENMIGGSKQELENGMSQIEKRKIVEEENIDQLFDTIVQKTNNRREYLKTILNELAAERSRIILETMDIKNIIEKEALIHLDRLEEMSRIELMKNRIILLKKVNSSYDQMLNNMRFSNIKHVPNFCLETEKDSLRLLLDLIENLGRVNPTISTTATTTTTYQINQQLNNSPLSITSLEFFYDRDYIAKDGCQFDKTSYTEHSIIMSSKKLNEGIIKWKIHLNTVRNWIGVGICQQSVFDNKDFKNFKSPYQDHKIDMISSNGYVWSCSQRILNHTQKGFSFNSSEDLECELNCYTKTLTFKKGVQSYCIGEVQLPAYPVIVLLEQNDSASFYL